MAAEAVAGALFAAAGAVLFALGTIEALRNYHATNSLVWFCACATAGLAAAASVFWFLLQLAPHVAVLAMVLAFVVQLSAFAFLGLYVARKRVAEQRPL